MHALNRASAQVAPLRPLKIIQFGGGNFLRGFCDAFVQQANDELGFNGNIAVIQYVSPTLGRLINQQQGLYHLVLQGQQAGQALRKTQLIDSISFAINPEQEPAQFLALAQEEELRYILSNTTEAGIVFEPQDSQLSTIGKSFPAKLTQLLYARYQWAAGDYRKGLIILPCELIENNGTILKKICLRYAELWQLPAEFVRWLEQANHFTSTLVDRIVSGFPKEDPQLAAELNYHDELIVIGEPYAAWLIAGAEQIADELIFNHPCFKVKLVSDLAPYRELKVRLLNAVHTALVPLSYLSGEDEVRSAVQNPLIAEFLQRMIASEIIPTLSLSTSEAQVFAAEVFERFANPYLKHLLLSIALNSTAKFVARNLPIIKDYQAKFNHPPRCLSFALAALLVFYRGKRGNEQIPLNDNPATLAFFAEEWAAATDDLVAKILVQQSIWQEDLTQNSALLAQVSHDVQRIMQVGITSALEELN